MRISSLFSVLTVMLAIAAHGQVAPKIVGPEYPVVQHPQEYKYGGNNYCGEYFTREAATQYGGPYLAFYYRDGDDSLQFEEASLKDVSVMIVPNASSGATPGIVPAGVVALPKATLVGRDGGEKIWTLTVTETMSNAYAACLEGISRKTL